MTPLDILKLAADGSPWGLALFLGTLYWLERRKTSQQDEDNKSMFEKQMDTSLLQAQHMAELKATVASIRDSITHIMARLP